MTVAARLFTLAAMAATASAFVSAQSPAERVQAGITAAVPASYVRLPAGVTRADCPIPAFLSVDDLDYGNSKTRVLLVGGLMGDKPSVAAVIASLKWFAEDERAARYRERFSLSAIPCGNPEGWVQGTGERNSAQGEPWHGYPPADNPQAGAYGNTTNPERYYLWRWIGMHAPDLVVDVRPGIGASSTLRCPDERPPSLNAACRALRTTSEGLAPDELAAQLGKANVGNVGRVPALRLDLPAGDESAESIERLLATLDSGSRPQALVPSEARIEMQARVRRTPLETSQVLAKFYGHDLNDAVYIPAVALIGRLRLGELTRDTSHLTDIERIVAPYATGEKSSLPPGKASGSHLSGHLIFGELRAATGKPEYLKLAKVAADLGFDAGGSPRQSMPYHNEMSDAVFMGCPILAQVGKLTGESKYYDACLANMRFMLKLNLRADGLHRHSPLDETAWGRGNGFPALGLALSLAEIPEDYAGRDEMLKAFQAHLRALAKHQDASGCWHQVVDMPGSYRELSCTAMIGFAMSRGIKSGWLEKAEFEPKLKLAWQAVNARIGADGGLVDVCTGTGKQQDLRAYLDRPAILGRDLRGGAMTLLFATEMAR